MKIRIAHAEDAAAIAAIYAPIVANTAISFETEPPDAAEMRGRIGKTAGAGLPWLVAEDAAGDVCGYAYASRHRERAAYQWSVDVTVYVREDQRGRGVGRAFPSGCGQKARARRCKSSPGIEPGCGLRLVHRLSDHNAACFRSANRP